MTTQTEALKLADAYANARAGWYVESLYGTSKGYTAEKQREMQEAHAALVKALAQPEQEPVAIIHRNEYNEYRLEPHDNFDIKSIPFNVDVSLFKSPQRTWVGLTDEDVEMIVENRRAAHWEFVRQVEALLKEKNNA